MFDVFEIVMELQQYHIFMMSALLFQSNLLPDLSDPRGLDPSLSHMWWSCIQIDHLKVFPALSIPLQILSWSNIMYIWPITIK